MQSNIYYCRLYNGWRASEEEVSKTALEAVRVDCFRRSRLTCRTDSRIDLAKWTFRSVVDDCLDVRHSYTLDFEVVICAYLQVVCMLESG